jgi:predicted DNA binding CopG/RHH family protein
MDYATVIERVYEHIENGNVDKAVMGCLRIARHLKDYLYVAIFFREMYPNNKELMRVIYDDTSHLKKETQKFLYERSLEYWLESHTLDYSLGTDDSGEERNIFKIGVGELDSELEQCERMIQDMNIPSGMGEFDTAAFTDKYNSRKAQIRLRISTIQTIKERIKTRCLNYAIRIEQQLEAQQKTQSFLEQVQNDVNNYFKARSEDVYTKLQKATQLVDSENPEDLSLLLTQVRRAIKAAADFFYPPSDQVIKCSDGSQRVLGDEQYLNRLHEFLATRLAKSSSRDLLLAELDHLAVFARRLNDIASKGVHATVSLSEAKQGLLGLYLFLYNICSHLDEKPS